MRKLLLLAGPLVVAGLVILGASTAQAQESEVQPGPHLLCTMAELNEHGGICPAQLAAPLVGVRVHQLSVTQSSVTIGAFEKWAERPLTPSFIGDTYWAGWGTGNPLKGTYKEVARVGLVNATGYTATGLPAGTEVHVWVFPVVQEVEWVWGEPCRPPAGYTGPCGHYIAVSDPEGGSVTTTTLSAPLVRHAARVKR